MPAAQRVFVVHGAGNRSEADFEARVHGLQQMVGTRLELVPVWWGSAGTDIERVLRGLPSTLPPAPGLFGATEETDDEADLFGPTIAEAEIAIPEIGFPGGAALMYRARKYVLTNAAPVAADVFLYWHERDLIQQRVLDVIGSVKHPMLAGHSLGGIISFDLISSGRLQSAGLITFGSQSSIVHVLDPARSQLPPFEPPTPVTISGLQKWTNLWSRWDPLSGSAGRVFRLGAGDVTDLEAVLAPDTRIGRAHGAYWTSPTLAQALLHTFN